MIRFARLALVVIAVLASAAVPASAQDAIVVAAAPIYVYPDSARTPLRTAAADTRLRVIEERAHGWVRVEFQDPQYGRRVGYVQSRFLRIVRPNEQPTMDLSVPSAEMTTMRKTVWRQGPMTLGCTYHRVAWREAGSGRVQVDVFVRPQDLRKRGLAVTVKRFRDAESSRRCDLERPMDPKCLERTLPGALIAVGCDVGLAHEICESLIELLTRESRVVERAMEVAETRLQMQEAEDLPPPDQLWDDLN